MGCIGFPAREAQAIALVDDMLLLGAALVTVAGVELLTADGGRASATQFIQSIPLRLKTKMELCIASAQTMFYITSEDWVDIKEGAAAVQEGSVECSIPGEPVSFVGVSNVITTDNYVDFYGVETVNIVNFNGAAYDSFTLTGKNVELDSLAVVLSSSISYVNGHYAFTPYVNVNGIQKWAGPIQNSGNSSTTPVNMIFPMVSLGCYADGSNVMVGNSVVYTDSINRKVALNKWYQGATGNLSGSFVGIADEEIIQALGDTYNITNNYNNPAWDASNQAVTVPQTWDDTVNKDAEDVIAAAGSLLPPGTIDPTTTTDSWLQSIYNGITGVKSSVQAIPVALTGFFDPTLEVNWDPLKLTGVTFTNKFPFSLPWDILRSFQGMLGGSGWDGKIPISAHYNLINFDFVMDFSMFAGILSTAKLFELAAFDIGLILTTRKLMGGGV